jgi:LEA14-like dessication related protein
MKKNQRRIKLLADAISVVLLILILYIIADAYAISQCRIDTSSDSVVTAIGLTDVAADLSKTNITTVVTVMNPTILPVYMPDLALRLKYGETYLGAGSASSLFVLPRSCVQNAVRFELSNTEAAKALLGTIIDLISRRKQEFSLEVGVTMLIFDIPLSDNTGGGGFACPTQ